MNDTLLTLYDAHLTLGHVALLDGANLALQGRERIGLMGRNGAGKSSLLKVLARHQDLDSGVLHVQQGCRVVYVSQEPQLCAQDSVFEAVAKGLHFVRDLIAQHACAENYEGLAWAGLQTQIEQLDGWNWENRVRATMALFGVQDYSAAQVASLSGGLHKRVALAQAWVQRPEVLLLDEPTNHLDLSTIAQLEAVLQGFAGALILISHDRVFLDHVATRMIELDRGQLFSYPGNYAAFKRQREEALRRDELAFARQDKLLSQEELWIRKGVEARRTRSVARSARLQELRLERSERREQMKKVRLQLDQAQLSGRIVADLDQVTFAWEAQKPIVQDFSSLVLRGDRLGLLGPNGVGKTTLIQLLLGRLKPQQGKLRLGTKLEVAWFDQLRSQLDLEASLEDFVSPGSAWIEQGGKRKHVKTYLGDFLFAPERAQSPVRSLSGGERNRLLLARLLALPANVLVLDEPTNDLDIETLEMLEELLLDFNGTIILVSHDRAFLSSVATSIWAWEGAGQWRDYAGNVEACLTQQSRVAQWQLDTGQVKTQSKVKTQTTTNHTNADADASAGHRVQTGEGAQGKRKLSYKETRELEQLPQQIAALETEQTVLRAQLSDPAVLAGDHRELSKLYARDGEIEQALWQMLERWTELEAQRAQ